MLCWSSTPGKGYQDVYPGMEAVKSGGSPTYKDYTSDNARGAVEFYLDTNST